MLSIPQAPDLFGPDALAEVSLAIDKPIASPDRIIGRIDRLVLSGNQALVVDFKSDAAPPASEASVDNKYLAQLGAYLSAVRKTWPDRTIEAPILWTRTATLMRIGPEGAELAYVESNWDRRQN